MEQIKEYALSYNGRLGILSLLLFISSVITTTTNSWTFKEIAVTISNVNTTDVIYAQLGMWSQCVCTDATQACLVEGSSIDQKTYGHVGDVIRSMRGVSYLSVIFLLLASVATVNQLNARLSQGLLLASVLFLITSGAIFAAYYNEPMCNRKERFSDDFDISFSFVLCMIECLTALPVLIAMYLFDQTTKIIGSATVAITLCAIISITCDRWLVDPQMGLPLPGTGANSAGAESVMGMWSRCLCIHQKNSPCLQTVQMMVSVEVLSVLSVVSLLGCCGVHSQRFPRSIGKKTRMAFWGCSTALLLTSMSVFAGWRALKTECGRQRDEALRFDWAFYIRCLEVVGSLGGLLYASCTEATIADEGEGTGEAVGSPPQPTAVLPYMERWLNVIR